MATATQAGDRGRAELLIVDAAVTTRAAGTLWRARDAAGRAIERAGT